MNDKLAEYNRQLKQLREQWSNSIGVNKKVLELRGLYIKRAIKKLEGDNIYAVAQKIFK